MVFELELKSGSFLKTCKEISIDCNIGNVALFESNTEFTVEGSVKLTHHVVSHIRFQIEYLTQPDCVDEVSHGLFNFSCQVLIKSTSS